MNDQEYKDFREKQEERKSKEIKWMNALNNAVQSLGSGASRKQLIEQALWFYTLTPTTAKHQLDELKDA